MIKAHSPINWENEPSSNTPINETNLNKMDSTIGVLDDRIIEQETSKLDKATAYTMVKDISFNENNGVFTVTRLNGSTFTIDTRLEKIAINFSYNAETQQIEIILIDGTKQYIDISSLISPIDFVDSDTIGWEVTSDWKVKAKVLDGSITEDMLQPNYLAEIKLETEKSAQSMANAKQSELNAKASEESAAESADRAEQAASSGGLNVIEISSADYEDLPDKENDTNIYKVTDEDEYIKAENVEYGDSDVESALDEFGDKLSTIEEGANKTVVDSTFSTTSTNPIQNKVVTELFNNMNQMASYGSEVVSLTSGVGAAVKQVTLTAGTYLLLGHVQFGTNGNGVRQINFMNQAGYAGGGLGSWHVIVPAASNSATTLVTIIPVKITQTETWYLNAYQNSGSLVNANGHITVIKLV